jgi:WD40 repeat protein
MIRRTAVIVSGGMERTIRRWNAATGEPIGKPLKGHEGPITSVAFGMIDGEPVIISGGYDKTIRHWRVYEGRPSDEPREGHSGVVTSVAFGMIDGAAVVISGGGDGTVRRWDARTGELIGEPFVHEDSVRSVVEGASVIVSGGEEKGTIRRWDARTSRPIGEPLKGQRRPVFGNALVLRQPQQGALHVALVVPQRLKRQPDERMVQLGEIGSDST